MTTPTTGREESARVADAPSRNAAANADRKRPFLVDGWIIAAAIAVLAAYVRAIWFTPAEAIQGLAQKIYYLHVSAAINAYVAFAVVAITSAVYLWLRDPRTDRVAEASAEVGLLFTTVVLTTGPMWAKPIWGTWWTWDARLTLTLFLWFIYAGYIVLRGAILEPDMRARYSAVLGILGALLIPFIHMSVYLFRTLHPMPIVLKPDKPSLPPEMLHTFLIFVAVFFFVYIALLRARYRLGTQRALLAEREALAEGGH